MTMPQEINVVVTPEDWNLGFIACVVDKWQYDRTCALSQAIRKFDFVEDVRTFTDGRIEITNKYNDTWRYRANRSGKELITVFDNAIDDKRKYHLRTPRTVVLTMEDWPD